MAQTLQTTPTLFIFKASEITLAILEAHAEFQGAAPPLAIAWHQLPEGRMAPVTWFLEGGVFAAHIVYEGILVFLHGDQKIRFAQPAEDDAEAGAEDAIAKKIAELAAIADSSGYQEGWVYHQLKESGLFPQMERSHWEALAIFMGRAPGWAYGMHNEYSPAMRQ